jgi:hypothetical protein
VVAKYPSLTTEVHGGGLLSPFSPEDEPYIQYRRTLKASNCDLHYYQYKNPGILITGDWPPLLSASVNGKIVLSLHGEIAPHIYRAGYKNIPAGPGPILNMNIVNYYNRRNTFVVIFNPMMSLSSVMTVSGSYLRMNRKALDVCLKRSIHVL